VTIIQRSAHGSVERVTGGGASGARWPLLIVAAA
jgi:hypothetical protein